MSAWLREKRTARAARIAHRKSGSDRLDGVVLTVFERDQQRTHQGLEVRNRHR
jgi:hypothetical protein